MAAIVATVALVFVYNLIFYVPEYQSKATLYILKQNNNEQSVSASDFSTALNVVTCTLSRECSRRSLSAAFMS